MALPASGCCDRQCAQLPPYLGCSLTQQSPVTRDLGVTHALQRARDRDTTERPRGRIKNRRTDSGNGAALLGQPVTLNLPEVVGLRLIGALNPGVTATDLVLTVVERLRKHGVVQKFVECCGPGLASLPVPIRATIANMSPEYGATVCFFPVDRQTIGYLRGSGRDESLLALVEAYAKAQGLWRGDADPEPSFSDVVEIDLSAIEASVAGPRRPQDRMKLSQVPASARRVGCRRAPGCRDPPAISRSATATSRSRPSRAAPTPPIR
ncbi:MAG: aconitase family protein [Pseudomonadota bacterium]